MKKQLLVVLMLVGIFGVLGSGCRSGSMAAEPTDVTPRALESFYPGDIMKVDAIEMQSGSNGIRKTIRNQAQIREWVQKVRHLKMVPEPDQKESSGVLFICTLFQQGTPYLTFTPTHVNRQPIVAHSELADLMTQLYGSEKEPTK